MIYLLQKLFKLILALLRFNLLHPLAFMLRYSDHQSSKPTITFEILLWVTFAL
jgi:hypothetical protein